MKFRTLMPPLIIAIALQGCGKKDHNNNTNVPPDLTDAQRVENNKSAKSPTGPARTTDPAINIGGSGGSEGSSPGEANGDITESLTDRAIVLAASCAPAAAATCENLKNEINRLETQRTQALQDRDYNQLQRRSLDLSFQFELLTTYAGRTANTDNDVAALNHTYSKLKKLLEYQISMQIPLKQPYSPGELAAVKEVFTDFGDLYIKASPLDDASHPISNKIAITGDIPWAGYWFPKRDKTVFDGPGSALGKFDQLLIKRGKTAGAVDFEKAHYDANSAEWEGLCDAWAIASIKTREPKSAITFNDTNFSIADLKALTTKLFEGNKAKIYGRRYYGDYRSDGGYQNIRPEAFHKIVEVVLGKKNEPLVVNTVAGPEVWAEPIYQVISIIKADPAQKNAYLVTAWVRFVTYRNDSNETPTSATLDTSVKKYEYRLFVDPKQVNSQGELKVIAGEWLNDNLEFHPNFAIIPAKEFTPINKKIDENKNILMELLKTAGVLR